MLHTISTNPDTTKKKQKELQPILTNFSIKSHFFSFCETLNFLNCLNSTAVCKTNDGARIKIRGLLEPPAVIAVSLEPICYSD